MPRSAPSPSSNTVPPGGHGALRIVGGAALGLGLVVVVAVLSVGSGDGDRAVSIPQLDSPTQWFDVAIAALAFASLVGWVLIIVGAMADRGRSSGRTHPSRMIPGMLLAGAVLWLGFKLYEPPEDETVVVEPPSPTTTLVTDGESASSPASVDLGPIVAGAVLVVAAGAVVAWTIRRGRPDPRSLVDDAAVRERRDLLIGLLDDAIAELRAHPDPRAAVIATWARLEIAFGAVAIDRSPADTPARYLAKVLETVDASGPAVAHLTTTFERAMFSSAPIGRDDQQQAVDALVAVRDELHVVARRPAGADAR